MPAYREHTASVYIPKTEELVIKKSVRECNVELYLPSHRLLLTCRGKSTLFCILGKRMKTKGGRKERKWEGRGKGWEGGRKEGRMEGREGGKQEGRKEEVGMFVIKYFTESSLFDAVRKVMFSKW